MIVERPPKEQALDPETIIIDNYKQVISFSKEQNKHRCQVQENPTSFAKKRGWGTHIERADNNILSPLMLMHSAHFFVYSDVNINHWGGLESEPIKCGVNK